VTSTQALRASAAWSRRPGCHDIEPLRGRRRSEHFRGIAGTSTIGEEITVQIRLPAAAGAFSPLKFAERVLTSAVAAA